MDHLDDILRLLKEMAGLPFESMEVSTKDVTVRVNRGNPSASAVTIQTQAPERRVTGTRSMTLPDLPANAVAVTSPIIGVFYDASSPEDEPFVKAGDKVTAGQTLCIVEAMKLMNEIPSPATGTVLKVLAEDGVEVEVGQPLFLIEASEG